MSRTKAENFIGGHFVSCDKYMDSCDPSTGLSWAEIPDSGAKEINAAVDAAKQAFKTWSQTTPEFRSKIMLSIADKIEARLEEFAEMESRDQGKPISLARAVDIPRAVLNFRFFATAILHETNMCLYKDDQHALNYTSREPVGVAGLISPWNLPLYLLTFKVAPAIACGNTVVCKPSEFTSVTAWMMCQICSEAGLPPGVVNMVFGTGQSAGSALVQHPDVPLISFTGSTVTAETIRRACVPYCKKLSLELGGKNPALVFDDVNLEKSIPTIVKSCFANQGEICLCISRIFVQKGIYEEFLERFVQHAKQITVGDPRDPKTNMGALVSEVHMTKVKSYIQIAKEEGGTILTGLEEDRMNLKPENQKGYFVPPTVVTDVTDNSRLMKEEIFGPVVCVVPFTTENEVVERANDVIYGLCACVWSSNVNTIHRVSKKLAVGTVWANCWLLRDLHVPFGGTKQSGVGREGLHGSVDFYTEAKTVCVHVDQ